MTVAVEHFIIKLLLTHLILPLVGNNRVLSYFSLTIELGDAFQAMLLSPPLYHVWRMIDVVQMQITLMGKLSEGIEMILLICYPVGIHSPEHPLGCHLEEATSSPSFARFVCHDLKLETVSQLVSQTIEFLILNTVRCYPERADKVIVSSAVSSSFQRIVHHHHHLILVADTSRQRKLQGIAEETVESFNLSLQITKIEFHRLTFERRRILRIVSEWLFPEIHDILGLCTMSPAPSAIVIIQIEWFQRVGHKDEFLGCRYGVGRSLGRSLRWVLCPSLHGRCCQQKEE